MINHINELVLLSQSYGNNSEFVIAGGGNTSYKNDEILWVKASGTSLSTITEDGFVCLFRSQLSQIAEKEYSLDIQQREEEVKQDLDNCIVSNNGLRPSVETSLHEIIDYSFVVHTHPTLVNAVMCSQSAKKTTELLFGDEALFVEYTDPGYILFKKILDRIKNYKEEFGKAPQLIFLENHGIFVAADSPQEIIELYDVVIKKISNKINIQLPKLEVDNCDMTSVCAQIEEEFTGLTSMCRQNQLIANFVQDASSWKKVSIPFTPDIIVYCKSRYVFTEAKNVIKAIKDFKQQNNFMPRVLGIKGLGIIVLEENKKSANIVMEVFEDFMKICFLAENFEGEQAMTLEQIAFIDNWEVENYRRKVAKQN